jgi:hypothetical protein
VGGAEGGRRGVVESVELVGLRKDRRSWLSGGKAEYLYSLYCPI